MFEYLIHRMNIQTTLTGGIKPVQDAAVLGVADLGVSADSPWRDRKMRFRDTRASRASLSSKPVALDSHPYCGYPLSSAVSSHCEMQSVAVIGAAWQAKDRS